MIEPQEGQSNELSEEQREVLEDSLVSETGVTRRRAKKKRKIRSDKGKAASKPASPLQRAQRDRQSILYPIAGALSNLNAAVYRLTRRPEVFTDSEIMFANDLNDFMRAHAGWQGNWEEVKQKLIASVDNPDQKV